MNRAVAALTNTVSKTNPARLILSMAGAFFGLAVLAWLAARAEFYHSAFYDSNENELHAGGKGREGGVANVSKLPSGSRTCASVE